MAKRRGPHEGSIYQRSDGRWVGAMHLGYGAGRRRRRVFYGETRREAQERLTAALRAHQQGLPIPGDRQTVGAFLVAWLDAARPALRPATHARYEQIVRRHLMPGLGRLPLARLGPQQVQALLAERGAAGLSPQTVQHVRAVLRRALGQALRWGLVARNVATLVDPPRVRRQEVRPLDAEQVRTFLDAVRGDRLEPLYVVALGLGLRQGEALGLSWSDLALDAGTLTVRQALGRVPRSHRGSGERLQLAEPKTDRSRRTVALPAVAVAALREHRRHQLVERLLAGSRWQESGLVFTSTIGTPLDGCNVTRAFQGHLARAGLPRQRFHDLRHACASLLLAQGVAPRVVMETLGHSQIGITMNLYAHVMPALQREAAERMDAILAGG